MIRSLLVASVLCLAVFNVRPAAAQGRKQALLNLGAATMGLAVGAASVAFIGREKNSGRNAAIFTTSLGGAALATGGGLLVAGATGVSSPTALKTIAVVGTVVGAVGGALLGHAFSEPTGMRRPAVAGAGCAAAAAGTVMFVYSFWDPPPDSQAVAR
jgi:hypothetical protein